MEKRQRLLRDWLPVLLYCLLIFIQSSFPPAVSRPLFPLFDKAAHLGMYAVLGILFYRAFKTPRTPNRKAAVWAVFAAALYGISDEIHQAFVPERSAEAADFLADGLGGLLGVVSFVALFPNFRKPPSPRPGLLAGEIPD